MSSTTVPFAQAINIRQGTTKSVTMRGNEIVGYIGFSQTTPNNTTFLYQINPANLTGTRLNKISQSFQQYRVKKLIATLVTNLPTNSGGILAVGSTANPDQTLTKSEQVFALDGAQFVSMFVPSRTKLNFSREWLNIDPDSVELMKTTASLLAIALQSQVNITGTTNIPVMLEWEIEFKGTAIQPEYANANKEVFVPPSTCSSIDANYNVFLKSQVTTPVPVLGAGLYNMSPQVILPTVNGTSQTAEFVKQGSQSGGTAYLFYESEEAANNNTPIRASFNSFPSLPTLIVAPLN